MPDIALIIFVLFLLESEDFEEGLVSMLRCVSVSEELLDTTMKNVEEILQQEGDIFISYESLIFSLVQVNACFKQHSGCTNLL